MLSKIQSPQQKTRDVHIDGIRGYLLIIMSINHLCPILFGSFEEFPCYLCFNTFGIFTTYQGFLFISGLMCAKTYGRIMLDSPNNAWQRISKRIKLLYVCQLLVLFSLYIAANWNPAPILSHPGLKPIVVEPLTTLMRGLLLIFTPASLDVLPLYILFLGLFPFVFWAIKRGWSMVLLLSSIFFWILGQKINLPRPSFFSGFDPLSYQLLFFCGVWVGSRGVAAPWPSWYIRKSRVITLICVIICAFCFALRRKWIGQDLPISFIGFSWTNQRFLHLSILINFLASCQIMREVTIQAKRLAPLSRLISTPAVLGRYSLFVFVLNESIWNILTVLRDDISAGLYIRMALLFALVLLPALLIHSGRRFNLYPRNEVSS